MRPRARSCSSASGWRASRADCPPPRALAEATGARLAWVPRRAGDRGAVEAGCLPNLLPGGRPVFDPAARGELGDAWQLEAGACPARPAATPTAIIAAAAAGQLGALLVGGVDPADLADPRPPSRRWTRSASWSAWSCGSARSPSGPTWSCRSPRRSRRPAPIVDWEGRVRPFDTVLKTAAMSDARVLDALARELGVELASATSPRCGRELATLAGCRCRRPRGRPRRERRRLGPRPPAPAAAPASGQAVLATWHHLLDDGPLQDGDGHLAGTARPPVVRISKGTAADLGVADGDAVTVGTERGAITLPALRHRHGRRRRLGADQLARLDGAPHARRRRRCAGRRSALEVRDDDPRPSRPQLTSSARTPGGWCSSRSS